MAKKKRKATSYVRVLCQKCLDFGKVLLTKSRYCNCNAGVKRAAWEKTLRYRLLARPWEKFEQAFWAVWHFVKDIPMEIKFFIQRGRRGFSDRDAWNFSGYLSTVIIDGMLHLFEKVSGIPAALATTEPGWPGKGKKFESELQRWRDILYDIAGGFGCAELLNDGGWWDGDEWKPWSKKQVKLFTRGFNSGMRLFKKHFFILGD